MNLLAATSATTDSDAILWIVGAAAVLFIICAIVWLIKALR